MEKKTLKAEKITRKRLPYFDEIHLGLYVDVLMHLERDQEAVNFLENALLRRPNDPILNLRKADIIHKNPNRLDEALQCAQIAAKQDGKAYTTMAEILINKKEYGEALAALEKYPVDTANERNKTVVETIRARAFTGLGECKNARSILRTLNRSDDPYVIHAQIANEIKACEMALYTQEYPQAKRPLDEAALLLRRAMSNFPHQMRFLDQKERIEALRAKINEIRRSQ